MNPLPRGVTGFYDHAEAPPPTVDIKAFRAFCYRLARAIGAQVTEPEPDEARAVHNYDAMPFNFRGEPYLIVCNRHKPLLGIATYFDGYDLIRFGDLPIQLDQVDFGPFHLISGVTLNEEPTAELYSELSPAELEQIDYWEPEKVGHIIFNQWD